MADNGSASGVQGAATRLRASWGVAKPSRQDYGKEVTEVKASRLVGEGRVFERGPHVSVTHMGFFKPPSDALLTELRQKDRRSAKEWEYINCTGVWAELGQIALEIAREDSGTVEEMGRRLKLMEMSLVAAVEVLSIRDQYFHDINDQGMEIARQMAFLVGQGHEAVFSESYRSVRDALTSKMETEAAKQMAKSRIERVFNVRGGGPSGDFDDE